MHEQVERFIGRRLTDKERKLLDWLNGWDEDTILTFLNLIQSANRKALIEKGIRIEYLDEIDRLRTKLYAVNAELLSGPQPQMTAAEWRDWLFSVLPFLREDDYDHPAE